MPPAPTPAPAEAADLLTTKRQQLLTLSTQKQTLEIEVNAIISELTTPQPNNAPPIGIDTPLVDNEGYPRSDIDVYRARQLRKRFHEIKTDYKVLEQRIERGLLEITALREASGDTTTTKQDSSSLSITSSSNQKINEAEEIKARLAPKPKPKFDPISGKWVVESWDGSVAGIENGETRKFEDLTHSSEGALASIGVVGGGSSRVMPTQQGSTSSQQESSSTTTTAERRSGSSTQQQTISLRPFAIIDEVFSNSPSQEAGIQEGDLLLRFGTVTSDTHNGFDAIKRAIVTQLSLASANGSSISMAVRRTTVELGGAAEMIRVETFDLRPRPWAGQGLLGCHLQEYKE